MSSAAWPPLVSRASAPSIRSTPRRRSTRLASRTRWPSEPPPLSFRLPYGQRLPSWSQHRRIPFGNAYRDGTTKRSVAARLKFQLRAKRAHPADSSGPACATNANPSYGVRGKFRLFSANNRHKSKFYRATSRLTSRTGELIPAGAPWGDRSLVRRSPTAHGASRSVAEAESPTNSELSEKNTGHAGLCAPDRRRVSPTGFGKMSDVRGFVPTSDDQATAQVDCPAQTQALGNL
jgi:hypothetical protein